MNMFQDTDFGEPYTPPTQAQRNAAAAAAQQASPDAEADSLITWAESVSMYEPAWGDGFLPEPAPTFKQRVGQWLIRVGTRWAL